MEFVLVGKVVAINKVETVASESDSSKAFSRRKLYLDCSRYDSMTGEKLSDNFPLLDFGGKGLEQLNELANQGLTKGDLVSVKFAVKGTTYKDAQGNTKNYTGIRPYAIERYVPKSQQAQQTQVQQPAPQPAQQPAPQTQTASPFPPAGQQGGDDNDLPF